MRTKAAFLLAVALLTGACSESAPSGNATDKVTYLTSFNTFGRDAYAYVALDKGYFTEAGMDVTVNPGSATVDVLKLVAAGRADFGVGDFHHDRDHGREGETAGQRGRHGAPAVPRGDRLAG